MIVQNFDPLAGTTQDLVDFCERMERTEDLEAPIPTKKKTGKLFETKSKQAKTKWCDFCDKDNHNTRDCDKDNHNTRDCFKLKSLKNKRDTTQHSEDGTNKRARNIKWKKSNDKPHNEATFNREQVMALVAEAVEKSDKTKNGHKCQAEDLGTAEMREPADIFGNLSISSNKEESD